MRGEKIAKQQSILIIEPSGQFREELYNFLLSAGYENVTATDSLAAALDKIGQSAYDVVFLDAGSPKSGGLELAIDLVRSSPKTKIILMIKDEDQQAWSQVAAQVGEVHFLIKTTFARNLLYLLADHD
ncbi:MAG: response regulator [Acidobacteria bacterium]|nr:response regulator [Acidobacteriota bacterium]